MGEGFKRREPSQWGEGAALKDEILRTAARMLMESGREGDLSLRAVARAVGISAPSIYLHFRNRAELMATLTQRAYQRLAVELRTARDAAAEEEPRAALRAMARHYCCYALDNPRVYQLMFGIERIPVPREEADSSPMREVLQVWRDAVSPLRRGEEGPGDEQLAVLLWASLHGIVSMAVALPFPTDRQSVLSRADDLLGLLPSGT
ncbi:TetR/AcrR family transcriptional regulator [Streptomyces sp. NBC_00006]|uniref:TetR/AcrR family transcriptional regulator n=1 Tax=Streptomyces sp. NBC_00006 TaxID=2975619 RepID=UPI0022598BCE|nr:TetR/AcrR family transcriptional regulator [Streptomyces sp. NBC_00006]MCX5529088.1 TetR/AcrR family transcriptional regulator [Streptomyces sp. NBC_00006]